MSRLRACEMREEGEVCEDWRVCVERERERDSFLRGPRETNDIRADRDADADAGLMLMWMRMRMRVLMWMMRMLAG